MTVELLRCWLCSKVKVEASGKHEGLHCSLEGRFRLIPVVRDLRLEGPLPRIPVNRSHQRRPTAAQSTPVAQVR